MRQMHTVLSEVLGELECSRKKRRMHSIVAASHCSSGASIQTDWSGLQPDTRLSSSERYTPLLYFGAAAREMDIILLRYKSIPLKVKGEGAGLPIVYISGEEVVKELCVIWAI